MEALFIAEKLQPENFGLKIGSSLQEKYDVHYLNEENKNSTRYG